MLYLEYSDEHKVIFCAGFDDIMLYSASNRAERSCTDGANHGTTRSLLPF